MPVQKFFLTLTSLGLLAVAADAQQLQLLVSYH